MFDISCLQGSALSNIQEYAFEVWNGMPGINPLEPWIAQEFQQTWGLEVVGQHYFVEGSGGIVPVFDFTSSGPTAGNPNAIFFGKKIADASSPQGTSNVDWLELQEISGQLANQFYRVLTVEGQPPSSVSSSRLVLALFNQHPFSPYSASPDLLISLSSMPRNIVRVHDVTLSGWSLLTVCF
jgi:hypothetical protein